MRGEHTVGGQMNKKPTQPGLTWVNGSRTADELDETSAKFLAASSSGTSIFDPVLCELAYRWFSPPDGIVLDPFSGGSVRGIVASKLGRQYIGLDLRAEQIEANRAQGEAICTDPMPVWHCADSRTIDRVASDVQADFIFSCPPYADLERYSDDPSDLSTLGYAEFKPAYFEIVAKACSLLKNDRFACFVVGDVRDKKGNYYNFVGDTVEAFRAAGLHYYNEAILVTAVGSLPIRAGKQFSSGRKLGKTHQNVLVFVKGDAKRATIACGPVEFDETLFPETVDEGEPSGLN
jgi:DNA modification methylase